MSCSGIDEDYSISGLPPIPIQNKVVTWNGREVQVLDPSHSLIGKGVTIPVIPDHTDDTSFFQRFFTDLTHAEFHDDEEELAFSESDLEWAQALAYIGSNYSEDLTVEEILAQRGMEFDKQFGQFSQCKSIWKRIGHGFKKVGHTIEKGCRKGAKKTAEFVKEHKKEILIGTAIVVTAAAIGLGAAALLSAGAAGESALNDSSPRRREEKDIPPSAASGPDPKEPSPPPLPEQPPQNNNGNKIQQFFDNLLHLAPTPDPSYSIYKSDGVEKHKNNAPAPTPAPTPSSQSETSAQPSSTPPQQTSGNSKIQQFFDNVFKPLQSPHTNVNIHKTEGSKKESPAQETSPTSPQVEAPASSSAVQFRSAFGAYLQDLLSKALNADYQPASNQSSVIETVKSKDATTATDATATTPSSSNILGNIVEGIQQGLATIGQGMIDTELLNPNTLLDIFTDAYPQPSKISAPRPIIGPIDGKKLDERPHIPMMLFTALTLPNPPGVGLIPVLSPNGKLDWIVLSANWKQFEFSPQELKSGIVNLDAHIGDFIPKMGEQISIVTSQNGINVKSDEFVENCQDDTLKIASAMYSKVPRDCPNLPFYLGIYNPTYGLIEDLNRVSQETPETEIELRPVVHSVIDTTSAFMPTFNFNDVIPVIQGVGEKKNTDTPIVITTRNMMTAIAREAKKINSDVLWLDLRHSEAGLIYCRSFEGMDKETQDFLHKQLLSVALGPAESISNDMAKIPDNIFSEKDHITKRFSEALMNNPNYNIRVIACISPRSEFILYIADHARAGKTYDTALEKAINKLQEKFEFKGKADE